MNIDKINKLYELADNHARKSGGSVRVSIERWVFNHDEPQEPEIEYGFSAQSEGFQPSVSTDIDQLIAHLVELNNG